MIITLTGENTFAADQAQQQIIAAFIAKHGVYGVERVDAEELSPAKLPDLLQGATLFAPARIVIIKNLAANKAALEPLAQALSDTTIDTTVVIIEPALDKRTKLYKLLKTKTFKEFANVTGAQLATWTRQEVVRRGGEISAGDAGHLVARVAGDQWRLANEIDKLVSYQPHVTTDTIDLLVEPSPEGTAFDLLDAALGGNTKKIDELIVALKIAEDPYKLFGLLASQAHALAAVAAAGQRNVDIVAKDTGVHPFVVRKTQPIARRLGVGRVAAIAEHVATCDFQLKSTAADPWDLLRLCLQKIAN